MRQQSKEYLLKLYELLFEAYGPQHWWPADSLLELIIGAILTQNTAWNNVEKAIQNLKQKHLLNIDQIIHTPVEEIAKLIYPTGYHNIKAQRLQSILQYFQHRTNNQLELFFKQDSPQNLRTDLLELSGIGPETADSILLYGGNLPIFVIDNYTRRIFTRHGIITGTETYEEIRSFVEKHLPTDIQLYQEYHALIVRTGYTHCKAKPICTSCPLEFWRNQYIED